MQRSRRETRRAFIELPRIGEARLIRRAIVIHPLTSRRPTFREIAILLSSLLRSLLPSCGFALANFKSAISCGRYLTPVHSSSRIDIARFYSSAIAQTMTRSSGSDLLCAQGFTLMCLQWLLRFVARYNVARIRVTYSRGNWRNW